MKIFLNLNALSYAAHVRLISRKGASDRYEAATASDRGGFANARFKFELDMIQEISVNY